MWDGMQSLLLTNCVFMGYTNNWPSARIAMKLDLKRISVTDGAVIPFSYDADLTKEEINGEYPFRAPVHI